MTRIIQQTERFSFTITELVVVSVIMTTALLGVYTVFKQAMETEARASIRWNYQGAGEAILEELCQAIECSTNIPHIKTIIYSPDGENGESNLTCMVENKGYTGGREGQVALQRKRYTWNVQDESGQAGNLYLKTMSYAGNINITPISELSNMEDNEQWNHVPSQLIGKGISEISIKFLPFNSSDGKWLDSWNGAVGKVAVWVTVKVGDQTLDRVVVPHVNSATDSQEGS